MNPDVEKRLAESLTAESTDLIPHLPYLLQDFWSLAGDPEEMAGILKANTQFNASCRILDLACGKGAVSVCLVKEFGCTAKGIDLLPEFIAEAKEKAEQHGVSERCVFAAGDVNEAVTTERSYDLAVWSGAGDLLGSYPKTVAGIARTVKPGGYILLDEGYVDDKQELRFYHDYLTETQWNQVFRDENLTVVACNKGENEITPSAYAGDLENIRKRARELIRRYPEKQELFENYVRGQQAEYEDLQDGVIPAVWLLQKRP